MTDLLSVLPDFDVTPFSNLLPSLERSRLNLSDILTLDALDVAKQARLPAREVRRLFAALLDALLPHNSRDIPAADVRPPAASTSSVTSRSLSELERTWNLVGCLDESLNNALSGGFPTGYISEVTGESGAGKTHLLLTLLLAVQLPPPIGLGRNAVYISTEASLATSRLTQLLESHPALVSVKSSKTSEDRPSLNRILSISTPDLEAQDHIIRYQLPVAVRRHDVGLVVVDSITANFRAEFDQSRGGPSSRGPGALAKRSAQLIELGALLRGLARSENVAIVVANQVADRFAPTSLVEAPNTVISEPGSSIPALPSSSLEADIHDPMTLDHQQRWFTGWGDDPAQRVGTAGLKTPSLGLVWTNQLDCRVVLTKRKVRDPDSDTGSMQWKRHLKVVFAPWAKDDASQPGTPFAITTEGISGLGSTHGKR